MSIAGNDKRITIGCRRREHAAPLRPIARREEQNGVIQIVKEQDEWTPSPPPDQTFQISIIVIEGDSITMMKKFSPPNGA